MRTIQKKLRTVSPVVPDDIRSLSSRERDCLQQYTSSYTVSFRRYQRFGPCEVLADTLQKRDERIDLIPRQVYECDKPASLTAVKVQKEAIWWIIEILALSINQSIQPLIGHFINQPCNQSINRSMRTSSLLLD